MGGRSGQRQLTSTPRARLRGFALGLPGAREDLPWGESVARVGQKASVLRGRAGEGLTPSVKLPDSSLLAPPFASPTGHGQARGGRATATFARGDSPPVDLLRRWIEESGRAVAPRRLVRPLGAWTSTGRSS